KPNQNITRAEITAIIARIGDLGSGYENGFPDVSETHWARGYIAAAAAQGWINGYPGGNFEPENNATRAEVVTIVNRMLDRRIHKEDIPRAHFTLFPDLSDTHWAFPDILESAIEHQYSRKPDGFEIWL
ncbi:MAG: S-layer homology domain-containing protein, partial [Clostridiales bacterium]|nr:S-layer homology domain-containing protein [Clostridiales bacterium]